MAKAKSFKVGDKVRLTGKFLRSTGQFTGDEARRVWEVLAVDPGKYGSPDFITVNQPRADLSYWTAEELEADPMLKWRRIAAGNLQLSSRPDYT